MACLRDAQAFQPSDNYRARPPAGPSTPRGDARRAVGTGPLRAPGHDRCIPSPQPARDLGHTGLSGLKTLTSINE
jgi:hypothetical protein